MKILMCEFNGLGERGMIHALIRMGHVVVEYNKKCDNYDTDISYLEDLSKTIDNTNPDIVLSINYLPIVSKVCNVYGKLYYAWIYDCPEIHLYSKSITNIVNRIFIFDKVMFRKFSKVSPKTVFYLPLATEPIEDFDGWISEEEKEKYAHEVTFVGSLYNEKKRQYHQIKKLNEYEKGYVNGISYAQMNIFGYNFIADSLPEDIIANLKKQLDYAPIADYEVNDRDIIADHYIGMYASSIDRINTLQKVTEVNQLSVYTDSDVSMLNNIQYCGVADSKTMTPQIYHLSKINLNITLKTIQSGIPLRVFDVLGAKGFLITNYQPEISEYFIIDKELVVYESMRDLQNKIIYYLNHEEERMQIAQNGYDAIVNNYTYDKMLDIMLSIK